MDDEMQRRACRQGSWPRSERNIQSYLVFPEGGKLREKFYNEKYCPSPIPKGGLEIVSFSIIEETGNF